MRHVVQQTRRIPFHVREVIESELQKLHGLDIILNILDSKHTDWVSPIVVVPKKNGKLRVYVDMRHVVQQTRRIPFHVREVIESELQKLHGLDIILNILDSKHTDWVSSIVVVPKRDGKTRAFVVMRPANTAMKRIRHPPLTVKDMKPWKMDPRDSQNWICHRLIIS